MRPWEVRGRRGSHWGHWSWGRRLAGHRHVSHCSKFFAAMGKVQPGKNSRAAGAGRHQPRLSAGRGSQREVSQTWLGGAKAGMFSKLDVEKRLVVAWCGVGRVFRSTADGAEKFSAFPRCVLWTLVFSRCEFNFCVSVRIVAISKNCTWHSRAVRWGANGERRNGANWLLGLRIFTSTYNIYWLRISYSGLFLLLLHLSSSFLPFLPFLLLSLSLSPSSAIVAPTRPYQPMYHPKIAEQYRVANASKSVIPISENLRNVPGSAEAPQLPSKSFSATETKHEATEPKGTRTQQKRPQTNRTVLKPMSLPANIPLDAIFTSSAMILRAQL